MDRIKIILSYLILFFAFTLPFATLQIDSIFIIILLVLSIFVSAKEMNFRQLKVFLYFFSPFLAFFIILVLGIFYSENTIGAINRIERNLSLIVFPIIFFVNINEKIKSNIPIVFVLGTFVAGLFCNIYQVINYGAPFKHGFTKLTEPISIEPTYFSTYMLFAISICILKVFKVSRKTKIGLFLLIFYFIYFIIKLGSKSALIVLFFVLTLSFFFLLKESLKIKYLLLIPLFIIVVFFISYFIPMTYNRFYKPIINSDFDFYQFRIRFIGERYYVWKCAIESLSNDKVIFGYGTGDEVKILMPCYEKYRIKYYLNPHNIYLSTMMRVGLIGLIPMLFSVLYGYWKNGKQRIFILFTTIIMIMGLTESLFDRSKGIVFFAFFSALFVTQSIKNTNK